MTAAISHDQKPIGVLIAGIGAGSLGLEINKSLRHAGNYRLIGTDISDKAFGLYGDQFDRTFLIPHTEGKSYAESLLTICLREGVEVIAPGAEAVHGIIAEYRGLFEATGILPMVNAQSVIEICSDKIRSMEFLRSKGISTPKESVSPTEISKFPCIVKPAAASGGSNLVFLAEDQEEAKFFVDYITRRGYKPMLQEYIESNSEFTVGVVSAPNGEVLGSIALRRFLDSKLSISLRYGQRIISSGWSQGYIDDFPSIRQQAERIAKAVGSTWALNIQGRVDDSGRFLPFEINPRHSGTTFLRTLAGFNEPHLLLQRCLRGSTPVLSPIKKGYYLRGFTEQSVAWEEIRRRD